MNRHESYASLEDLQRPLLATPETEMVGDHEETEGVNLGSSTKQRWYQNSHQVTAMISNFSTSYNVVNISLVLPMLKELHSGSTDRETAIVASSLLAGMIFGQLVGGALGDSWLGRMGALRLVMALQIIASFASAFAGAGQNASAHSLFLWLAGWRFVLGIGCGGVYPLAAVISAEEGKKESQNVEESDQNKSSSIQRVVLTFSMQGVGFVCVPLVAVFLFFISSNLNFIWRTMLGVGALPGAILMCIQCNQRSRAHQLIIEDEDEPNEEPDATTPMEIEDEPTPIPHAHEGWFQSLCTEPGLGRKVLGTAGTWFLFDVVFYGNTIFQPIVVEAAFGKNSGTDKIALLRQTALDSLILTSIALPGYAVAGIIMGKKTLCVKQTPRYVMLQGFAAMTILYATIGFNWSYLRGDPSVLVVLYGMTFFFANYGPNTTTFILPSLIFEEHHRATWNGVSAAAGKLGALTGATLFAPAADTFGDHVVMLICAGVACFAYIITLAAIPSQQQSEYSQTAEDEGNDEIESVPNGGEMA